MLKVRAMKIATVAVVLAITVVVAGCGAGKEPAKDKPAQTGELSGTIQLAGSTSVQPLSEELAKAFMAKNPKVRINVAGGGSAAGIKAAMEGTADIGASSRELKPEEKTVKEFTIALDGVAVIVHKDNKVSELKKDEIKKIFTGEITNWSVLGGEKGPIHVISREEGSGTRGAFDELVLGKDARVTDKAIVQNSTGAVRTAVAADKAAIGYISIGSLNNEVKALKVDGAEATAANIKNGSYKISRPFLYLTQKEPAGLVKAYLDFVLGPEGQEIVRKNFIPVK